jgi:hypothetical protein
MLVHLAVINNNSVIQIFWMEVFTSSKIYQTVKTWILLQEDQFLLKKTRKTDTDSPNLSIIVRLSKNLNKRMFPSKKTIFLKSRELTALILLVVILPNVWLTIILFTSIKT